MTDTFQQGVIQGNAKIGDWIKGYLFRPLLKFSFPFSFISFIFPFLLLIQFIFYETRKIEEEIARARTPIQIESIQPLKPPPFPVPVCQFDKNTVLSSYLIDQVFFLPFHVFSFFGFEMKKAKMGREKSDNLYFIVNIEYYIRFVQLWKKVKKKIALSQLQVKN